MVIVVIVVNSKKWCKKWCKNWLVMCHDYHWKHDTVGMGAEMWV